MKARHEFRKEAEVQFDIANEKGELLDLPNVRKFGIDALPRLEKDKWIESKTDELYYDYLRVEFAKSAMQGLLSNNLSMGKGDLETISLKSSDLLIAELKKSK